MKIGGINYWNRLTEKELLKKELMSHIEIKETRDFLKWYLNERQIVQLFSLQFEMFTERELKWILKKIEERYIQVMDESIEYLEIPSWLSEELGTENVLALKKLYEQWNKELFFNKLLSIMEEMWTDEFYYVFDFLTFYLTKVLDKNSSNNVIGTIDNYKRKTFEVLEKKTKQSEILTDLNLFKRLSHLQESKQFKKN
jgi:hypothetical protein